MNRTNAIVFIYRGKEPEDDIVKKLASILFENKVCIPEMLTIKVLDENSLAKQVIKFDTEEEEENELNHAVLYVGRLFQKEMHNLDTGVFAISLSTHVRAEINRIAMTKTQSPLINAVKIIADAPTQEIIKYSNRNKCNYTPEIIRIIKLIKQIDIG